MPEETEAVAAPTTHPLEPERLRLSLVVTDPELVAELLARPEGEPREAFALAALRIGILTLKQAQGRLDADTIRHESERLLANLAHALAEHQRAVTTQIAGSLREYFDPTSGRFNERVNRLIAKDGELAALLRQQVGPEDSQLARTLASHVGEASPIMKMLSPEDSRGFLRALTQAVETALAQERAAILTEFSLDREDSALSRLVKRVETSQGEITGEFSLDNEASALARMRRELLGVLAEHRKAADDFRTEMAAKLAAMTTRREEALRSPRHGQDFEAEVRRFITDAAQRAGDVAEDTSNTTGLIKNSKVGDLVVTLGPECVAAGARIVAEAKESGGYTLAKALDELETARKNRGASVGLFVFSRQVAPPDLEPMRRYGSDVVVVWDPQDPQSDPFLTAGLTVARAICTQEAGARDRRPVDLTSIEKAIRAVEKLAGGLDEIRGSGETIQTASARILDRVRIMGDELRRQVRALDDRLADFKSAFDQADA